jgi:hypothetical protein
MVLCLITRRKKTWWRQGALLIQKDENKELSGHQVPFFIEDEKKKHLVAIRCPYIRLQSNITTKSLLVH